MSRPAPLGVVACEALYPEVEAFAPEADVRYVPQELHEFPVNVPRETEIGERLQAAVDDLDHPVRERVVVLYANSGSAGGLAGLRSTHADLVVSRADDCVSTFTYRTEPWSMGEPKEFGTYYLTRGVIDCGVDSYKLSRAYLGEVDALLERFERAAADHGDMRVTWADGDRFARARARSRSMSPEQVGRFFFQVVRYFDRIKLVDTGRLYGFHREYAGTVRGFVEDLRADHGDGGSVDLSVVEGDTGLVETLLGDDPASADYVDVYPPGTPVE